MDDRTFAFEAFFLQCSSQSSNFPSSSLDVLRNAVDRGNGDSGLRKDKLRKGPRATTKAKMGDLGLSEAAPLT